MDPSKRICLKNLPEGVTKREIAELVRNRTGAQPHSIDLGNDAATGATRRYAHFSCEGAKTVLEVLQAGVVMRDQTVYGHQANPHFSFAVAEGRRKREREEEVASEELKVALEGVKERALARTRGGELNKNRIPKPIAFSVKAKYGLVAAEIAKRSREACRQRRNISGAYGDGGNNHTNTEAATATGGGAGKTRKKPAAAAAAKASTKAGAKGGKQQPSRHDKKTSAAAKKAAANAAAAAAAAAAPPPPPQPTKEEKKLSGLQARLAALKEKLKKN